MHENDIGNILFRNIWPTLKTNTEHIVSLICIKLHVQNFEIICYRLFTSNWLMKDAIADFTTITWAPSSKFVSSSIPSWHILTVHAQPFRGARDLAFCLKVSLDSLLVWASSGGSGETAQMRRLAWTFAARIDNKYQIRLTRSTLPLLCFWKAVSLFDQSDEGRSLVSWCYSPSLSHMWFSALLSND